MALFTRKSLRTWLVKTPYEQRLGTQDFRCGNEITLKLKSFLQWGRGTALQWVYEGMGPGGTGLEIINFFHII